MQEKFLLGFSLLPNFGISKFSKIFNHFQDIESAWKFQKEDLKKIGFSEKQSEKIFYEKTKINLEVEYEKFQKEEIEIISPFIKEKEFFPRNLQEINGSPFLLFVKGNPKILLEKQLAVVGTRRPTIYGKQAIEKIVTPIATSGFIITSGMATGIDSLAHEIALKQEQPTIAVLGSGLSKKILSHSSSFRLGEKIISEGGALVSEYPPEFPANKFTFPARNRIISGLSLGILVIEAGEKSGSLITAKFALEQNREIFALPGNIFSPQSVGTNWLIKEGAHPVSDADDIFSIFGFSSKKISYTKEPVEFDDPDEDRIYKLINYEPIPAYKITETLKINPQKINQKLSVLELKGLIKNINGGFIRI